MGPFACRGKDCPRVYGSTDRAGDEVIMALGVGKGPARRSAELIMGKTHSYFKDLGDSYHTHTVYPHIPAYQPSLLRQLFTHRLCSFMGCLSIALFFFFTWCALFLSRLPIDIVLTKPKFLHSVPLQ